MAEFVCPIRNKARSLGLDCNMECDVLAGKNGVCPLTVSKVLELFKPTPIPKIVKEVGLYELLDLGPLTIFIKNGDIGI